MSDLKMEAAPPTERRVDRTTLLRWSHEYRYGEPSARLGALRKMTWILDDTFSGDAIVKLLGDPQRRHWRRAGAAGREMTETMVYRHPDDDRVALHALVRDGRFEGFRFVIDEGAALPPRLMGVDDFWDRVDSGIELEWEVGRLS